jgi:DNA polymerase I
MNIFNSFKEVWLCDFEFAASPGERPKVICLVAKEYHSGRLLRLWADALGSTPPFDVGPDSLFVAYFASAELGCFLTLGWPIPVRILDLFTEFRNLTNGSFP